MKVDLDKDGHADAVQALDAVDQGLDALVGFLSMFDEDDFRRIVQNFNVGAGGKLSTEQVEEVVKGLVKLPQGLAMLDVVVEKMEAAARAAEEEKKKKK